MDHTASSEASTAATAFYQKSLGQLALSTPNNLFCPKYPQKYVGKSILKIRWKKYAGKSILKNMLEKNMEKKYVVRYDFQGASAVY